VEITTATTADVDVVVDLWVDLASDQQAHSSHLLAEANRTAIREAVVRRVVTDDVLLARADGDVVGFAMTAVEAGRYEQDVTRGLVENIYVRPEYRGRGIGSRLLAAAETSLGEAGADVVALDA
jgi:ribosomal protein S18 acetylase RimI-like enzyme